MDKIILVEDIIRHIRGHNKKLTIAYLRSLDTDQLLCEVHPLYFDYYKKKLSDEIKNNKE